MAIIATKKFHDMSREKFYVCFFNFVALRYAVMFVVFYKKKMRSSS